MSHIVTYKIYPCDDFQWVKVFKRITKCIHSRGTSGKILSIDLIEDYRSIDISKYISLRFRRFTTVIKVEVDK